MKRVPVQRIVFGLLILLLTTTTPAQRSFTSTYDSTRKVTPGRSGHESGLGESQGVLLHECPRRKWKRLQLGC